MLTAHFTREGPLRIWEWWTPLCYLVGAFPQLNFGSLVLCHSYRNPALLAKMEATIQLFSGGRFILGWW